MGTNRTRNVGLRRAKGSPGKQATLRGREYPKLILHPVAAGSALEGYRPRLRAEIRWLLQAPAKAFDSTGPQTAAMRRRHFLEVDVTTTPFTSNPAAVVLDGDDCHAWLTSGGVPKLGRLAWGSFMGPWCDWNEHDVGESGSQRARASP